jgi:hypothetical protein
MSVDICYLISHGFASRMVFHSGLIPALKARGLSVAVIAPNADEPNFQAIANACGVIIEKTPHIGARRSYFYGGLRPYLYEDVRANPALWAKHVRALHASSSNPWHQLRPRIYWIVNRVVVSFPFLRRVFSWIERNLLRNSPAAQLLQRLQPELVISTYPIHADEASLLLAAQSGSITTVGHLLSWDNITSKGRFTVVPEYYLAWGPIMRAELEQYYDIRPEKIVETGIAHFDIHYSAVNDECLRQSVTELGLDPARPYLFFGMSSPEFGKYEIEIVEWLAGQVKANRYGPATQLIIRPHPQNVRGHMADTAWLPRLDALKDDRVAVDYPRLEDSSLLWNMHEDDLTRLANLLAGCAICLNSGSTLSLDAIVHDKPVILTMFDANHCLPWWQSAARLLAYQHQAKLVELAGVRVVRSFDEIDLAICTYLEHPELDADGRARTREQETGPCDGLASQRIADALIGLLDLAQRAQSYP